MNDKIKDNATGNMETLGVSFNVPLIPIPISDSASFGAQQYGHSHHNEVVPKKPGRKIPKAVFTTSGINNPILKITNKQSGICHIEAIIIATLPIKDCPGVKITVDGEIILLTHTNNANIMNGAYRNISTFQIFLKFICRSISICDTQNSTFRIIKTNTL